MNWLMWTAGIYLICVIIKWFIWRDREYERRRALTIKARRKWEKENPDWYRREGFMGREARDERQRGIDLMARQLEKEERR